ncbi:MAG: RES domain-containing protein [Allosphingosinicella sp.]
MPDDEPTEYLITQMIADYLASRPAPGLDGILFKSVQRLGDRRNVVLFHHASRVETIEMLEDVEVSVHQFQSSDDGPEPDYTVWEEVPSASEAEAEPEPDLGLGSMLNFRPDVFRLDPDADDREPYLRVNRDTLIVRHVMGVTFDTADYAVQRHRSEKHDLF